MTRTKRTRRRSRPRYDSPPNHREQSKRHRSSPSPKPSSDTNHHQNPQQKMGKRPSFVSYLDSPNLHPKPKLLCEIIANTPSIEIERVLNETGIRVSQEDVEDVLKLSYGSPGPAVKFFRWSGHQLNDKHSPYAWNLVVDLLGKNCLFDAMWDAIKSMRKEGLLSLATFASVFSSYVTADRVDEAIMTLNVMDQYGCARDVVALNSLVSAICRDGKTVKAQEFLRVVKDRIRPDADTYAILLEGWESEGNVVGARETFGEMVLVIGWDPANAPAYESFLNTLLKAPDGIREALKFFDILKDKRCFPGPKFFKVALDYCVERIDIRGAESLWHVIEERKVCRPDTQMYTSMIALHCYGNDTDMAKKLLDGMVYNGAFPDSETYNYLFRFLIKGRKLRDVSATFNEMLKNECLPTRDNCTAAIKIFMDTGDHYMAIKVWKFMVENYDSELELEETGNFLVTGLRDINRLPEAIKYAEDMIARGIKLSGSSMSKLKQSLTRAKKPLVYDDLLRKWKAHGNKE